MVTVIAVVVHTCCCCGYYLALSQLPIARNSSEAKIGSAEERAREIIDEALKTAETKKREALLEAKEESIKDEK